MLKKCQNKTRVLHVKNTRLTTTPSLPPSPVCPSNTSPCVRPNRPRVCQHHAHILKHVCTWVVPVHTDGDVFERTHADVLSGHTGFFSVSHTTPNTHHNTRHDTTQHDTPQHTTTTRPPHHTETETVTEREKTEKEDREGETEKERQDWKAREDERGGTRQDKTRQDKRREEKRREEKRRQDKTRQDKTREEKRREEKRREENHFQCGGAWPFLVDVVLCLGHPVNDRVFSLLNRVKYDCSLIFLQCILAGQQFFNFCELF